MARNKSEKLTPRVRALLAYADACEAALRQGAPRTQETIYAWSQLDDQAKADLHREANPSQRNWRKRRLDFIRSSYAP